MTGSTRRRSAFLGILAASLVFVAGCGGDDNEGGDGAADQSKEPILIGAVKGVSGFMESFDVPPLQGAELAVQDINEAGGVLGRPLKIEVRDYHSKAEDSGPAARELVGQGAKLLLTACDFDLGAPAAQIAQASGVLAFSDCAGSVQFGPQGIGPLAYTMGNSGLSEGAILAEFAVNDKKLTTAWTLQQTNQVYYDQVCSGFKDRFTEIGGKLVGGEVFQAEDTAFGTQIAALRRLSPPPDFIFICGFNTSGAAAMRQLRAANFDQPIMSSNTYDGDGWKKAVPDLSNFYYTTYASLYGDDPSAEVNEFMKRYEAEYGGAENANTVTGYSVIQAFALAAEEAQSLEGPDLAKALDTMGTMEDALVGPTTYSAELHIDLLRRQNIMEVQQGESKFLKYAELDTPPKIEP